MYIAEISSSKLKGVFGNCNQLFITLGIMVAYLLGIKFKSYRFSYSDIALVAAGFVFLFEFLMLFMHETPRWFFSKGRDYDGIRALKILRGSQFYITTEIEAIKAGLRRTYSAWEQLLEFRHRPVYHPFILIFFLMFFQQFSGINAAVFYASQIFSQAGYDRDAANLVTFGAVGCVQVVSTLVSVILVDYLGRRKLLVASSVGMVVSSFLLGVYFLVLKEQCQNQLNSTSCPHHIEIFAIICVVTFFVSFSLGWGPIPWSSMSELLPNQVRTLGGSISTFANWGFAVVVTVSFQSYTHAVSPTFTWWSFTLIMVLSIVFVVLFLPEAKNRSLEEIQEHFERGRVVVCSCGGCCRARTLMKHTSSYNPTSSSVSRPASSVNY